MSQKANLGRFVQRLITLAAATLIALMTLSSDKAVASVESLSVGISPVSASIGCTSQVGIKATWSGGVSSYTASIDSDGGSPSSIGGGFSASPSTTWWFYYGYDHTAHTMAFVTDANRASGEAHGTVYISCIGAPTSSK